MALRQLILLPCTGRSRFKHCLCTQWTDHCTHWYVQRPLGFLLFNCLTDSGSVIVNNETSTDSLNCAYRLNCTPQQQLRFPLCSGNCPTDSEFQALIFVHYEPCTLQCTAKCKLCISNLAFLHFNQIPFQLHDWLRWFSCCMYIVHCEPSTVQCTDWNVQRQLGFLLLLNCLTDSGSIFVHYEPPPPPGPAHT